MTAAHIFPYHIVKINYNGFSNIYTFFHVVEFKKFLLPSAAVKLNCGILEGTISSKLAKTEC